MKCTLCILALLFLGSCGSLRVSPQGCRSQGLWGKAPENTTEHTSGSEQEFSEEYTVFLLDKEVRLRDFLKEKGIACEDVKSLRVRMESVLFVKRKLSFFIRK